MGKTLIRRRGLSVTAGVNILGVDIVHPEPSDKLVFTVVADAPGVLSIVRIDGTGASEVSRVGELLDGASLTAAVWSPGEVSAPTYYSLLPNPVRYNFRYSVNATFDLFIVYGEKEHAATLVDF